jgi:hypothetical protein
LPDALPHRFKVVVREPKPEPVTLTTVPAAEPTAGVKLIRVGLILRLGLATAEAPLGIP